MTSSSSGCTFCPGDATTSWAEFAAWTAATLVVAGLIWLTLRLHRRPAEPAFVIDRDADQPADHEETKR